MLMPRTCSLSIGTAHDSSVLRSLRFGLVPGSRMPGMISRLLRDVEQLVRKLVLFYARAPRFPLEYFD